MKKHNIIPAIAMTTFCLLGCSKESTVIHASYEVQTIDQKLQTSTISIGDETGEFIVIQPKVSAKDNHSNSQKEKSDSKLSALISQKEENL